MIWLHWILKLQFFFTQDTTLPEKSLALPRSAKMSCQNRKQMERESEMEVQEESIKNDTIQTFCTEKNPDKLNHMSEVNGNRMLKRGLLESYQNGIYFLSLQIKKSLYIFVLILQKTLFIFYFCKSKKISVF